MSASRSRLVTARTRTSIRSALRRSAGVLRQPVAHGARQPREAHRRRTQVLGDTLRVDAQVVVDQDVAEAAELLQLFPERGLDDAVRAELGDDVLVVRGADPEVRAQDVVADVEEDLGAELEPALDGPVVPKAPAERPGVDGAKLLEPRDHFLEPQEALADRLGPKDQATAPRGAPPRAATAPRGKA